MDGFVPQEVRQSVKSHLVLERGGRKIGIIGYITDTVPSLSETGEYELLKIQLSCNPSDLINSYS